MDNLITQMQAPHKDFNIADYNAKKAKEAAKDFEAFFVGYMVDLMTKELPTEGFFGGGQAEKIYRSLLAQELGKEIAENGSLGISDMVEQEIVKMQSGSKVQVPESEAHNAYRQNQ